MFAVAMDSEAWRRKNDGVLEMRQSAASTPLCLYPESQISLARREPNPLIPNQHLNPLHGKQRGILNEDISAP